MGRLLSRAASRAPPQHLRSEEAPDILPESDPEGATVVMARKVFLVLAWLFVLAVAVQFLLAGLGILGGESLEPHRQWGFVALHLIPVLMLIAAIVGRMGRRVIGTTVGVFVLVFLQPLFAAPDLDPQWLRSLHVLNALFIAALGYDLARRGSSIQAGVED
jgi:Family of unknown function (DUF6220)